MSGLHLIETNLHEVSVGDRRILFHIPTSSLFELDQVGSEMLTLFRAKATVEAEDVRRHFDGRFPPGQVVETIKEFLDLDILNDGRPMRMERAPVEVNSFPLSTVVLNINTGCNLSCTYCYKEDLVPASQGERMEFETAVDYFNAHRFGLTISMDGPKALHDLRRKTVGGKGSYDVVARNVRMLLARYRSRPVGARVTLTKGVTDVVLIHDHLFRELGFYEVGFSPVTAGDVEDYNLDGEELALVFRNMRQLGEQYRDAAVRGENIGFSNMHQLMTDLHDGLTKALPCGAGVGLLAVDKDGGLNLCHRFTGSDLPTFGNVTDGIDKPRLGRWLEQAADRTGTVCETCRIRNLCSGGCYHESYAKYHDPHHPNIHYCDLMRDWIDFGITVYAEILEHNPGFFDTAIEPRRAYK